MLMIENCKLVNDIFIYIVENIDRFDVGVDIDRVYCIK